jgi:hypothetical protein
MMSKKLIDPDKMLAAIQDEERSVMPSDFPSDGEFRHSDQYQLGALRMAHRLRDRIIWGSCNAEEDSHE